MQVPFFSILVVPRHSPFVIAGLDPAIHLRRTRGVAPDRRDSSGDVAGLTMDRRVKPGDDNFTWRPAARIDSPIS